jgi:nucleotide-binding universal stress UspA family protein
MTDPAPAPTARLDRVVVSLDFSEPSMRAVEWVAQHFARGAELVLVHAIHLPTPPRFLAGRYPPAERLVEPARAGAERRLRELATSLATGLIWTEVRVGRPDEEIVRVAEEYRADLIVVGRPAPRAGLWGRLGTTAQRVLRRATVPVLLAAELPPRAPSRLLVGVDDSALTAPVLDWALLLAERFAAEAAVVHVVHPLDLDSGTVMTRGLAQAAADARGDPPIDDPALRDAERWIGEQLDRRLAAASVSSHRERIVPVAVEGLAARVLVEEAARRGAELLVVGSRGAGAAERLLLGSVAEAVLRDTPCPALVVVRPGDAPE